MAINIQGIDKGALVAALYNHSKPLGMGMLHFDPKPMTADEGAAYAGDYIDYLKGRVMKVNVRGDTFDPFLYDRDNGQGAAERIVNTLKNEKEAA